MLFNELEIAVWSIAIRNYFCDKITDVPRFEIELLFVALATKDYLIRNEPITIQPFISFHSAKCKQFNEHDYKRWHQINKNVAKLSLSDLNAHFNKLSQVLTLAVAALSQEL